MDTGLLTVAINNFISSIFWDIWRAEKKKWFCVRHFRFSSTLTGWHLTSILLREQIVAFASLREADQAEKSWIALDFVNNGNERQSRLQEYADNVLESCLDNTSESNLSKRWQSITDITCHVQDLSAALYASTTIAVAFKTIL